MLDAEVSSLVDGLKASTLRSRTLTKNYVMLSRDSNSTGGFAWHNHGTNDQLAESLTTYNKARYVQLYKGTGISNVSKVLVFCCQTARNRRDMDIHWIFPSGS